MYQVVASDLDGTLLPDHFLTPYAKETLKPTHRARDKFRFRHWPPLHIDVGGADPR